MDTALKNNINTIEILIKKSNKWLLKRNRLDESLAGIVDDIECFLMLNKQFIPINAFCIINLDFLEDCHLHTTNSFVVVAGKQYNVSRRLIPQVRVACKAFFKPKQETVLTKNKATWISKTTRNNDTDIVADIKIQSIKYLIRRGTLTDVFYEDGTKRSFYETLRYFEELLTNAPSLIRVRRNCIVNIKHLNEYKSDSATKTAKIKISSKDFDVSRRLLPLFKQKRKKNSESRLQQ